MNYILTCPNCNHKEVSDSKNAYHNCNEDTSYKMEEQDVRRQAVSRIHIKIRKVLEDEGLISDEAFSFGNNIGYSSVTIPFDVKKRTLFSSTSYKIEKEKVTKALDGIYDQPAEIKYKESNLIDKRVLRKVEFFIPLEKILEVEQEIVEEVRE